MHGAMGASDPILSHMYPEFIGLRSTVPVDCIEILSRLTLLPVIRLCIMDWKPVGPI